MTAQKQSNQMRLRPAKARMTARDRRRGREPAPVHEGRGFNDDFEAARSEAPVATAATATAAPLADAIAAVAAVGIGTEIVALAALAADRRPSRWPAGFKGGPPRGAATIPLEAQ